MIKRFLIVGFSLSALLLGLFTTFWITIHIPARPRESHITLSKGMTLRQIARTLREKGIVRQEWAFIVLAHLMGKSRQLQAGDYLFEKELTPAQVLDLLAKGVVVLYKVQIIEGWTLNQIGHYLSTLPFIQDPGFVPEFLRLAHDRDFIDSLELHAPSLEGYLLPDTYSFSLGSRPKEYLETFVGAFKNYYQELLKETETLPVFSEHETSTLASLIEKETGRDEERGLIASVFYNRLKKKMPLASDPTVIYGLKNFSGNLTKQDLARSHPYNTYLHTGLPPGPICNPGRASLLAALKPTQTDYLYFVSKNDGTHHFSKTVEEHAAAVQRFQPRLP